MNTRREFRDSETQRIIERAAEIDAQRGQPLDAKALREIAAEAGISPAAVDEAIGERLQPAAAKTSWITRHRPLLVSLAIVAAIAFFLLMVAAPATTP